MSENLIDIVYIDEAAFGCALGFDDCDQKERTVFLTDHAYLFGYCGNFIYLCSICVLPKKHTQNCIS